MVLVSFCTPVLNDLKRIKNLIYMFKGQSDKNFELIIVDGGSSDGTKEFLMEQRKTMPQLKVYDEKGKIRSTGNARNQAIKNANGKFIMIIDSDAIFEKDFVKKVNEIIKKNQEYDIIEIARNWEIPKDLAKEEEIFFYRDNATFRGQRVFIKKEKYPDYEVECSFGEDKLLGEKLKSLNLRRIHIDENRFLFYHRGIKNINDFVKRYLWYGRTSYFFFKNSRDTMHKLVTFLTWISIPIIPLGLVIGVIKGINKLLLQGKAFPRKTLFIFIYSVLLDVITVFAFSIGFWMYLFGINKKRSKN